MSVEKVHGNRKCELEFCSGGGEEERDVDEEGGRLEV